MELSDYLRILKQRGWIIILMALLTATAAFGFSKMQPTVYESNLKLLVLPSRTDFGQAQAAKELLRSYEQWMLSSYRADEVINLLGLDMTPGALLNEVKVASDNSSFVGRSGKDKKSRPYPACRPRAVAGRISKAEARKKTGPKKVKWSVTASGRKRKNG